MAMAGSLEALEGWGCSGGGLSDVEEAAVLGMKESVSCQGVERGGRMEEGGGSQGLDEGFSDEVWRESDRPSRELNGAGGVEGEESVLVRENGMALESQDVVVEEEEEEEPSAVIDFRELPIEASGSPAVVTSDETPQGNVVYVERRNGEIVDDEKPSSPLKEMPDVILSSQGKENGKGGFIASLLRRGRKGGGGDEGKRDGFSRGFSKVRYTYQSSGVRKTMVMTPEGMAPEGMATEGEEQMRADITTSRPSVDEEEAIPAAECNSNYSPPAHSLHEDDDTGMFKDTIRDERGAESSEDNGGVFYDAKENGSEGAVSNGSFGASDRHAGMEDYNNDGSSRMMVDTAGVDVNVLSGRQVETKHSVSSRKKKSFVDKGRAAPDGFSSGRDLMMNADSLIGAERAHDSKRDGYITSRLFAKPLAGRDDFLSNFSTPSPNVGAQADNKLGSMGSFEITFDDVGDAQGWNNVYPRGEKPAPRYFHAAAVVGRKMVVAGGQTASGPTNDLKMLHLGRMTWSELGRGEAPVKGQVGSGKSGSLEIPSCRGHSLISWGKTVLLVGGDLNPSSDRIEVWSFDLETECWTKITAKGEIPSARSGQSVTRAGSILIMFGGENAKGHKLNDLHILDLKSLMWLPLHTLGPGPSPRARHCAAMYDDRFLLIFGGASKSKSLNDVFALDFETMEWSKMKTKGTTPSPRSGHAGVLVGDKWYIAGGENRGVGVTDTLMLDVGKLTWSVVATTTPNTAVANQGLSLVLVQRKEKTMLVAFGGKGSELCNQVQVLYIMPLDHVKPMSPLGGSNVDLCEALPNAAAAFPTLSGAGLPCACVDVAKTHLYPAAGQQYGGHSSPGNSPSTEQYMDASPGLIPLRKRYAVVQDGSRNYSVRQQPEEILSRVLRETSSHESTPSHHFKASDSLHQDLEIRFSDMEAGSRLAPIATHSSKTMRRPGGSSRRKESFDSNLSSVLESAEYVETARRGTGDADANTRLWRPQTNDRSEGYYTSSGRTTWEREESTDSQLLADLQDATTMERRIHLVNKFRQSFEMKLAASVRKNEVTEGRLAAALKGKEEAEKSLAAALKSRQKAEGKLAAAVKLQMELKERVVGAEQAQEDSNNLCNVVHSENLRLEHDLAFLKAVLEDTQKELHSTRSVLATERSRSFQLQMEVFDLKKKLPTTTAIEKLPSTHSAELSPATVLTNVD